MTTIIIISIALFIIIVVLPSIAKKMDEREKRIEHIKKEWKKAIDESVKETKLMNSKDIPTDEDIELYYKMYLLLNPFWPSLLNVIFLLIFCNFTLLLGISSITGSSATAS